MLDHFSSIGARTQVFKFWLKFALNEIKQDRNKYIQIESCMNKNAGEMKTCAFVTYLWTTKTHALNIYMGGGSAILSRYFLCLRHADTGRPLDGFGYADLRPGPLPEIEEKTRLIIVAREDLGKSTFLEHGRAPGDGPNYIQGLCPVLGLSLWCWYIHWHMISMYVCIYIYMCVCVAITLHIIKW